MQNVSVPVSDLGKLFPSEAERLFDSQGFGFAAGTPRAVDGEIVGKISQYSNDLGAPAEVTGAVDAMRKPFVAVITGQQPSLGGGPAYVLWKALTAVRVARSISEKIGVRAIPIFWNHSDDSNTEPLLKLSFTRKGTLYTHGFEGRGAVPAFRVDLSEIEHAEIRKMLEGELGPGSIGDAALQSFDRNIATAFTKFLFRFLGKLGLVVVEPRILHGHRVEAMLEDAKKKVPQIASAMEAGAHEFEKLGMEPPLKYEGDSGVWAITAKGRVRAENAGGEKIERLCPAVFLRPVVQDSIFPTAAYVAGPHEYLYHIMMKRVYEVFGVVQPAIVPRLSATFVTTDARRALEGLGTSAAEVIKRFGQTGSAAGVIHRDGAAAKFGEEVQRLANDLERGAGEGKYGKQTGEFVARFAREMLESRDRMIKKIERAAVESNEAALRRLNVAVGELLPNAELQERTVSWLQFLNTFGESAVETALQSAAPSTNHLIFG